MRTELPNKEIDSNGIGSSRSRMYLANTDDSPHMAVADNARAIFNFMLMLRLFFETLPCFGLRSLNSTSDLEVFMMNSWARGAHRGYFTDLMSVHWCDSFFSYRP